MNKLRKKLIKETETIEAYASDCQSACYYNCSGPCNAHQTASFEATTNSAYYYMYK